MNLILLSGGSGKRLWPLSNDVRSKQFLKILTDETGQKQSMVQRVYGQIKAAMPEADLLIATGSSQVDAIKSQLGDNIEIILEPERRDTFPAIALASVYLSLEKNIPDEEVIVVLPVDPYTEPGYFEVIKKMAAAVKNSVADIVLMGVKPTFPSPKYGYIVPTETEQRDIYTVSRFTEKPSYEEAQKLIENGAVWNGGVFAFKLGYLIGICRQHLEFDLFQDFHDQYRKLEKISFDYKVVEKASSVAMILFEGKWKDLGTWSTLTDEMHEQSVGITTIEDCERTYAINELDIPLLVLGTKNVVVAASPDGILISDIESSAQIKKHVDDFSNEGYGNRPMFEERRWGEYRVVHNGDFDDGIKSLTKHMMLHQGKSISYQTHQHRNEVWTITNGSAEFVLDGKTSIISRGDVVIIKKGQKHTIRALSNTHIIEVQIGDLLSESDIVRYEWDWI